MFYINYYTLNIFICFIIRLPIACCLTYIQCINLTIPQFTILIIWHYKGIIYCIIFSMNLLKIFIISNILTICYLFID